MHGNDGCPALVLRCHYCLDATIVISVELCAALPGGGVSNLSAVPYSVGHFLLSVLNNNMCMLDHVICCWCGRYLFAPH